MDLFLHKLQATFDLIYGGGGMHNIMILKFFEGRTKYLAYSLCKRFFENTLYYIRNNIGERRICMYTIKIRLL